MASYRPKSEPPPRSMALAVDHSIQATVDYLLQGAVDSPQARVQQVFASMRATPWTFRTYGPAFAQPDMDDQPYAAAATETAEVLAAPQTPQEVQADLRRAWLADRRHDAYLRSGETYDDPDGPPPPWLVVSAAPRHRIWG
jgi:hypothetical protein